MFGEKILSAPLTIGLFKSKERVHVEIQLSNLGKTYPIGGGVSSRSLRDCDKLVGRGV